MENNTKKILEMILSGVVSLVIAIMGAKVIQEFPDKYWLGLTIILLSFLFLYFSYYVSEIRNHKKRIENIEYTEQNQKERTEINEKLLNIKNFNKNFCGLKIPVRNF